MSSIALPRAPQSLAVNLPAVPLNVLFLGTCQVEPIAAAAERFGHHARHMLHDSGRHSPAPDVNLENQDASVVALTLRHIFRDATGLPMPASDMALVRLRDDAEAAALLERCGQIIQHQLAKLHEALKSHPTFFLSFLRPSFNAMGALIDRFESTSPGIFIDRLNQSMHRAVKSYSNFYYLELNEIVHHVGTMHLRDDATAATSHAAYIQESPFAQDRQRLQKSVPNFRTYQTPAHANLYFQAFWSTLQTNLKILRQNDAVKLVIVDLDDTLWRGIAAEEDAEGWQRVEGWPLGFVEALLYFKRRGGLLAVCSKNDEGPTLTRLDSIWAGAITAGDFASIKINWRAKSENVAEILSETNLLPASALFIDDNPREIDEVKQRFPDIRCLSDNHYDWRRILLTSPETQVATLTAESRRRTELMRARVERGAEPDLASRRQWLDSLQIRADIFAVGGKDSPYFGRALELINKTNQFNTTGKRWLPNELEEFIGGGGLCLAAAVTDRTTDNGLVGVALVEETEIAQVVLSCRVFGLGAEVALGSIATACALERGRRAVGRIVDTGRNFACHKYFEQLGFAGEGERFEAARPCEPPQWIAVTVALGAAGPSAAGAAPQTPLQTGETMSLYAPAGDATSTAQWHNVEWTDEGQSFRWTAAAEVDFGDCEFHRSTRTLQLPFLMEIDGNFADRSVLLLDGKPLPTRTQGKLMIAEIDLHTAGAHNVRLVTPAVLSPFALRRGPDDRKLGLAVAADASAFSMRAAAELNRALA